MPVKAAHPRATRRLQMCPVGATSQSMPTLEAAETSGAPQPSASVHKAYRGLPEVAQCCLIPALGFSQKCLWKADKWGTAAYGRKSTNFGSTKRNTLCGTTLYIVQSHAVRCPQGWLHPNRWLSPCAELLFSSGTLSGPFHAQRSWSLKLGSLSGAPRLSPLPGRVFFEWLSGALQLPPHASTSGTLVFSTEAPLCCCAVRARCQANQHKWKEHQNISTPTA
jgi:hypothetical protein